MCIRDSQNTACNTTSGYADSSSLSVITSIQNQFSRGRHRTNTSSNTHAAYLKIPFISTLSYRNAGSIYISCYSASAITGHLYLAVGNAGFLDSRIVPQGAKQTLIFGTLGQHGSYGMAVSVEGPCVTFPIRITADRYPEERLIDDIRVPGVIGKPAVQPSKQVDVCFQLRTQSRVSVIHLAGKPRQRLRRHNRCV